MVTLVTSVWEDGALKFKDTAGNTLFTLSTSTTDLMAGFKIGGVAMNSTAAELNKLDQSAMTDTITSAAKTITAGSRVVKITGGEGFTGVVLPAPTAAEVGQLKIITLDTLTSGAVTMALTNAIGGSQATSASFDAAGETLVLIGAVYGTTYKWLVLKEHGVTLS